MTDRHEAVENWPPPADDTVAPELGAAMQHLIDHVVDQVPGVTGAVIASADGHALSARLPGSADDGRHSIAAMSAATVGLSNRLVQLTGASTMTSSHHRSADGQVFVFAIERVGALTVLADDTADPEQLRQVGREITGALHRLFVDAAV